MPEIDVKWPEQDLRQLQSAINRSIRVGKRDIKSALIQAGVYLARSASAATNKEPKKRRAYVNKNDDKRFPRRVFPFFRNVWRKGPDDTFRWYVKTKSDPEYLSVKRAGLAKKSWYWMIPSIRRRGGGNWAQEVNHRERGIDYEIEMSNKLSYIRKALKTGDDGNLLLMQALGKATRQLDKDTDRRLKRLTR